MTDLLFELNANGSRICVVTHDSRTSQHADREVHLFDGKELAAAAGLSASMS